MKTKYVWKVLSEDGLLKDPPIFTDCYHYEFDVNEKESYGELETEEQAYENLQRVSNESKDWKIKCYEFVLIKTVKVY